ncbi:ImmA/IrrE family metallo-endopeptidase [Nocardiopsis ansamitocini]|uniref:IrrE N-terminal-like domain-containing protein n=1 Tax=Nocardiopsis ansamitocini TaxID=1670832 RepID=A0A9W6PBB9_9ACTN|nr:ImmA/IrrE family metallo-endopeptidase [Nocardiopsis ansamitocini]GLU50531.1 hypothetical protein Nans01_48820 [Nocardiopsis ansamitocini]
MTTSPAWERRVPSDTPDSAEDSLDGHARTASGPEAEREANRFAGAFLMPRADVVARMPIGPQVDQILKAKGIWRVSAMALTHRLHDLEMLTDWQYGSTCRRLTELGYRSGEPDGINRETSQVLPKVFALLRQNGQSAARVAAELHIPLSELNALMFGLSFTARTGAGHGNENTLTAKPALRVIRGFGS